MNNNDPMSKALRILGITILSLMIAVLVFAFTAMVWKQDLKPMALVGSASAVLWCIAGIYYLHRQNVINR